MAAKASTISAEVLERYRQLISSQPDIELKGAAMPYTSINGNMFSFLSPDGALNLRLSQTDLAAFLADHKTEQTIQHGVVLKDYAIVPPRLIQEYRKTDPLLRPKLHQRQKPQAQSHYKA
jgi:hypothetical protein